MRNNSIVTYKTHEFAFAATELCKRTIVVTSHRCLVDEVHSALGAGWVDTDARKITHLLQQWIVEYAKWKAYGAFDMDYDLAHFR